MPMSSTDFARLIKETWKGQICIREATQMLAYRFQCWQGCLDFHSLSAWTTANSADFSSLLFPLAHFLKFQEILQAKVLLERVAWTQRSNWILCNHHKPAKGGQRQNLMSILTKAPEECLKQEIYSHYMRKRWNRQKKNNRKYMSALHFSHVISNKKLNQCNFLHICFLQIS